MAKMSPEQIARAAFKLNLLNDSQLQDLWSTLGSRNVSTDEFTQALLGRDLLTSYQLSRLQAGEKTGFFYGDYKVLYFVGSGSFSRVYRAVQQATGQMFAVKALRARFCKDTDEAVNVREQFGREGKMGMTLRHPNIVPIYDVGVDGKAHYMVMEFVEGRNLREFVDKRQQCDPDEAVRLIMDVLSGLDYAFQRGIAHRDVKLSNVLVSSRGTAKLVDFGLAAAGKEVSDEALGDFPNPRTVDYAALERSTGVRRDDRRSDIFFVGCMLYQMLTGESPLPDTKNRTQRMNKARFQQIKPVRKLLPSLHPALVGVVNKAMQLDPPQRYQTPKEFLIDLDQTLGKLHETRLDQVHDDDTVVEEEDLRPSRPKPQRSVMFVESDFQMQDVFRQRFKTAGFRVLVISDPQRARSRFDDERPPAQCVVFSTHELGEEAVEAYQQFIRTAATSGIPAILLLADKHREWADQCDQSEHHVVVQMPVKLSELRTLLDRLVPHVTV